MSLVALDNALQRRADAARFHADPRVQAAELLLQERIPQPGAAEESADREGRARAVDARRAPRRPVRRYVTPHTLSPRTHLLSNGSYAVMVTNAGGGYSRRQDLALTRWREDITTDAWGSFSTSATSTRGEVWSTTYQPTAREPDEYEVTFAPDRAVWRRVDDGIETRTEIVVSPEDDAELRRVSLTNHGRAASAASSSPATPKWCSRRRRRPRRIRRSATCSSRPPRVPERDALICARRPRTGSRPPLPGPRAQRPRPARRRDRIRNRSRALRRPRPHAGRSDRAVRHGAARRTPPAPCSIRSSACARSCGFRPAAPRGWRSPPALPTAKRRRAQLIEKYHDRRAVARALALASTHSQIELRHLGLTVEDTIALPAAGRPAAVRRSAAARRPRRSRRNRRGQRRAVEVRHLRRPADPAASRHRRRRRAAAVPRAAEGARVPARARASPSTSSCSTSTRRATGRICRTRCMQIVESGPEQAWIDRPGGVFLRRADLMPAEDQTAAARRRARRHGRRRRRPATSSSNATQHSVQPRAGRDAPSSAAADSAPCTDAGVAAAGRPRAVQRPRRICRRRPRVRHQRRPRRRR